MGISPDEFPPSGGPYTGDYVYITEPGRYTLEHSLSHQYPVGVIIAASSVILDGQGSSIQPAPGGTNQTVGIWISLTDTSGRPVTGVSIRNVSLKGETCGIFAEGLDSSLFPWGRNRDDDSGTLAAIAASRSLTLSGVDIVSCRDGIILQNQSGAILSHINSSNNSESGAVLNDGLASITDSSFSGNSRYGIEVTGGSGTEISGSAIDTNGGAGIRLNHTGVIRIFNNAFNNALNLDIGPECKDVVLATYLQAGTNIVGGHMVGGNYWATSSVSLPARNGILDGDGNGIGDSSYEVTKGISDPSPLFKPGDHVNGSIQTLEPVAIQSPTPIVPLPTPVPTQLSIISGIHAGIVSDTIPSEMEIGKTYPVSLDLLNDGSEDWITQQQVGILALEEAASYGPEWMLAPISGPVRSGQIIRLDFSLHAPSKPGIYSLKYQAAREGSGVEVQFGRAYTKSIMVR